ncbi:MAG: IS3 family transposase, partial [Mobiluncus sp.]|nr:IS3 family transposase [Mobiluncus sp.]
MSRWVKQDREAQTSLDVSVRERLRQAEKELARLREENLILKKSRSVLREGIDDKQVVFAFIDEDRVNHKVSVLCRVLGVTRGGYYAWRSRSRSARDLADQQLLTRIRRIYDDSKQTYGAPRVLAMLKRIGIRTSKRRIARLMRLAGMQGVTRAKKYRAKTRKQLVRPDYSLDLVRREFHAEAPNRLWFADITYVKTYRGWLFLAVVFDIYSR